MSQVHLPSAKKTTSVPPLQHSKMSSQSNKSSFRQFFPECILTSSKAEWELITERSRHRQALLTLQLHFWSLVINCCFNHKLFHWARMKNFVFIHWRSLCKAGLWKVQFSSRLDRRPVIEESQLNSWARAGKQIKLFMFLFLCFLVWPYNKHLINQARSVCMGESWPRSLVQTSLRAVCTGDLS